jgi:hypothetical protein
VNWLRDTCKGFFWPYAAFLSTFGLGISTESHWRPLADAFWPFLAVAVVTTNVTMAKVKRGMS